METLLHKVDVMSVKTANKEGVKYLGKNGEQAYRVSLKIGNDWFSNMLYDEVFIPKKGTTINIKLEENGEWKNWEYATMTKKEQIMTAMGNDTKKEDAFFKQLIQEPEPNRVGRGASWNCAFSWCLKNCNNIDIDQFCLQVAIEAEKISKHQEKFVNME